MEASLDYMVRRGTTAGPFLIFSDGSFLTHERFVQEVRLALDQIGLDSSNYTGHSFRIGAATTTAQQGIQDILFNSLGRWESSAHTLYVKTPCETLCSVTGVLVS